MWLTVSSWLAASAAVEWTNSSLKLMGVCGMEDTVDVAVLGVARIDIYEVRLWCAFIHTLHDPLDSNLRSSYQLLETRPFIYHGLHQSHVPYITRVYAVVRKRTVRLLDMLECMG
jgi:hypothetical protein